jgi:hypothetical protein
MIGDLNSDLLCSITNTRDKSLNKYDNYMVIGDLNSDLMCPITNTVTSIGDWTQKVIIQITYRHVIVVFSQTFGTSIGDWTQ